MDSILLKILDFFLENKFALSIKEKHEDNKLIKMLYDKQFMVHIIKYLIVGVIATIVCIGLLWVFIHYTALGETELGKNVANFLSIAITTVVAYILNRTVVFESKEPNIIKEFSKFVVARIVSMVFDMISFFILVTLCGFNEMAVKVFNEIGVVILNYIFSKKMVFVKKETENV